MDLDAIVAAIKGRGKGFKGKGKSKGKAKSRGKTQWQIQQSGVQQSGVSLPGWARETIAACEARAPTGGGEDRPRHQDLVYSVLGSIGSFQLQQFYTQVCVHLFPAAMGLNVPSISS